MAQDWWRSFFDEDYITLWGPSIPEEQSDQDAEGLWKILDLRDGSRLLDAPCGYGRLSRRLAKRGAQVVGVDQSQHLLNFAEESRGAFKTHQLQYRRHDLRQPLKLTGFDAAINIFSSIGYGSEEDDLAILKNLREALKPGGLLFVETNHRDSAVLMLSRIDKPSLRLPDGTLVIEEPKFDLLTGQVETTWYWSGPGGSGQKSASLRVYSATELISLLKQAGLRFLSAHRGCSTEPFPFALKQTVGRIGLLAQQQG